MKEERIAFIQEHGISCTVNGTATTAIIGRSGKKTNNFAWENERQGSFLPDFTIVGGALVANTIAGETYFVRSVYPEVVDGEITAKIAQMLKINADVNILRLTETLDEFGNVTGTSWVDTVTESASNLTAIKAFAEFISASMRQTDPGLLASTVIRLYVQSSAVMQLLDRVMIGGKAYQIDAFDELNSPGLAVVQLSADSRA